MKLFNKTIFKSPQIPPNPDEHCWREELHHNLPPPHGARRECDEQNDAVKPTPNHTILICAFSTLFAKPTLIEAFFILLHKRGTLFYSTPKALSLCLILLQKHCPPVLSYSKSVANLEAVVERGRWHRWQGRGDRSVLLDVFPGVGDDANMF